MTASVRDRRRELVERRLVEVGQKLTAAGRDNSPESVDVISALSEIEQLLYDQLELLEKATQRAKVVSIGGATVVTCECCDDDEEA